MQKTEKVLVKEGYLIQYGEIYRVAKSVVHHSAFGTPGNKGNIVDRTGEVAIAKNGQKMTVIAYRGCKDCDIKFEDGTLITGREYRYFKAGEIGNPNYMYRKKKR